VTPTRDYVVCVGTPTDENPQTDPPVRVLVESPREGHERWVAEVVTTRRVVVRAASEEDAKRAALVLGLRVVADHVERGASVQDALAAAFAALQEGADSTAARKVARVLTVLLRAGGELKQRAESLRLLAATGRQGRGPQDL
jgi:hypothetical protein